jgi:hypothetical protein
MNQSWISSNNLLAAWQFDNNLIEDLSNTTATSAQSPTYITGYVNQALLFYANQYLTSSYVALAGVSFTIDTWISQCTRTYYH